VALTTRAGLKTAIIRATARADLSDDVDDWIVLFEKDINITLHRREMSILATAATVADQRAYALPLDFGDAIELHLNTDPVRVLTPSEWARVVEYSDTGEPREYAITANQFVLGPIPDAVYTLGLYYYQTVTPLVDAGDTNWVLTNYPGVYYYGVLQQAAASGIGMPDAKQGWVMAYQDAFKKLKNDQVRERSFGGGPLLRSDFASTRVSILTDE
jgi:hypothetical protein